MTRIRFCGCDLSPLGHPGSSSLAAAWNTFGVGTDLYSGRWFRVARTFEVTFVGLISLGVVFAAMGFVAAGAVIGLVGFIGAIALHLAVGIAGYRRAMDHEWPKVEPRRWDDDW